MRELSAPLLSNREGTEAKRDVHAFGHEVLALVCHHQVDLQRRMPAHENSEPGDDLANGKVRSQTDPQYAAQLSRSAGRVFRLVEFREDRLYASQEVRAGVGYRH